MFKIFAGFILSVVIPVILFWDNLASVGFLGMPMEFYVTFYTGILLIAFGMDDIAFKKK